jgi:hypothetical protein
MDKGIKEVISRLQEVKRAFIPPKRKMEESIENDTRYLMALGSFIQAAEKMMKRYEKSGDEYSMTKVQLEIFDAVGKLQANQGLVNDKMLHYEKVFLPMYEKDMKECGENFETVLSACRLVNEHVSYTDEENKIIQFIKNEVSNYEQSELKNDEEYILHTYKILKRLQNKLSDASMTKASSN